MLVYFNILSIYFRTPIIAFILVANMNNKDLMFQTSLKKKLIISLGISLAKRANLIYYRRNSSQL